MTVPEPSRRKKGTAEFVRWFAPLLDALRELGGSASPREASDKIAEMMKVPDAIRNEGLKSGQERFHNQVQWARQYLAWEGSIDSSQRGVWSLTARGRSTRLSEADSQDIFLRRVRRHVAERK